MHEKVVVVMPGTIAMPPPGVLKAIAAETPAVQYLLTEIDKVGAEFDVPPLRRYLTDPSAVIDPVTPEAHYLALMAVSLAVFEDFIRGGGEPYAITGQSIGELWALVAARGLQVSEAARLACVRSQALTELGWPGSMMVVGAGAAAVGHLVGAVDHSDLVVACVNAPRQTVVCGPRPVVATVGKLADELGWATSLLPVPHASHTPAIAPAGAAMVAAVPKLRCRPLRWRLWSPTLRRWVSEDDDPVESTIAKMTRPVHFRDSVVSLYSAGVDTFLECGAQEILAKLIHASLPMAEVVTPLAKSAPLSRADTRPANGGIRPEPARPLLPVPDRDPSGARFSGPAKEKASPEFAAADGPAKAADTTQPAARREDILAELQQMYGDYLGYPPELLGEDDRLEADLGVESLKQVSLLVRVGERYGIGSLRKDVRLLDYPTLGRIADMVADAGVRAG
ncbi:acyltransferase domain-containing protein [Streptomyces albicerus]|uniref:acyltransferase domain-containing protein n=1 Tax=Streptomyces albicerus TaxID=2569859 RepID=UPI001788D165|nr:acyltransferase domain-containing protein [Streptomyces albicerus]